MHARHLNITKIGGKMMEGIRILSTEEVVSKTEFNSEAALAGCMIIFAVFIILGIFESIKEHDWLYLAFTGFIGLFISVIVAMGCGLTFEKSAEYTTQYKVIISEEVSFIDFYEKYEIVDQDGEIYTIREKLQQGE